MKMELDIENMTLNEYLEYEAEKERRLWDNVRSKSSPTRKSQELVMRGVDVWRCAWLTRGGKEILVAKLNDGGAWEVVGCLLEVISKLASWGGSIGPEGFMPSILLLVVIIVVVVVIVVVIGGAMAGVDINTLTMEQYLSLSRENQASDVVKPEIRGNVNFEIKSQFMRKLREETFSENKNKDAHDHVERVLNIDLTSTKNVLLTRKSNSWRRPNMGNLAVKLRST
nr:hypothetical protein [Tanacetum cinerariifolium]